MYILLVSILYLSQVYIAIANLAAWCSVISFKTLVLLLLFILSCMNLSWGYKWRHERVHLWRHDRVNRISLIDVEFCSSTLCFTFNLLSHNYVKAFSVKSQYYRAFEQFTVWVVYFWKGKSLFLVFMSLF